MDIFAFLLLLDHGAAFSIPSRFAMPENHCNGLQEVVGCAAGDMGLAPPWCRVKLQECVLEVIVQFHDSCLIAASVAVIRRRENCHHLTLMAPIITLHDQLMGSGNQSEAVSVVKSFAYILPKGVTSAPRRYTPATAIIGIGP
jgi:hypothetical protein